ncbi:hypothetical protein evm_004925 [Chilo suppressalis]|uniref:ATP-binding cassette subfamily C member 3 n=1 Tax=Chilo suppressalis TaxID=168631 RepID=A0A3S2LNC5_CHISP|nr:ATP-binding cassette subfamily C member 3 [Chilo suppressalis]RVE50388.1 hypothetical protein evm_004925 [Chilo suppressalis]
MEKPSENFFHKERKKPNIVSRIFFWWICPVLVTGNRRDVIEDDLIVPSKIYNSKQQGDKLEKSWLAEAELAERQNRKPSLWVALRNAYWLEYMTGAIYVSTITAARIVQPMLFGQLLSFWTVDSQMTSFDAGMYAFAMLGLNFVTMMCQHHNSLFVMSFSLKIKVACSALLYRKLLRLNQVSVSEVAGGKLVNLLSNDVARFDFAFMFMHYLWIIPIQVAVVLYFLWGVGGYAPFVGLFGVTIMILPIQACLTQLTASVRRKVAMRTDKRIKLMNEIINGIQVIKMYAWEKPFQLVVRALRAHEMSALRKAIFIRSVFLGFMLFTERSIMFFTVLTLTLSGSMISATTVYPIQQYLSTILINLTLILPLAIATLSEMKVSLERIQTFLELDEREALSHKNGTSNGALNRTLFGGKEIILDPMITAKKYAATGVLERDTEVNKSAKPSEFAIELSGVTASWKDVTAEEATLKNLSIRVRPGKLCAIIGPVGSGKTSLLQLLLNELLPQSGSMTINGKVSYSCQESWMFPGTVRDNILFGTPYDATKYKEVCRVCCLVPDFKQFPYGDLSLVGERGVTLSGGQRARINLARAVYRDADIYLLDDPLSAVDANVGRLLFEGCIRGYLREKTCLLVTHQIHYLNDSNWIVILKDGAVENMGTYDDLVKSGKDFSLLLKELQEGDDTGKEGNNEKRPSMHRGISVRSEENPEDEIEQVLEAEERAKGNLKWSVVSQYLSLVKSYPILMLAVLTLLMTQAAATFTDYWLSAFTNAVDAYVQTVPEDEIPDPGLGTSLGSLTTGQYLYIYGSVILGIIVFSQLRILTFVIATMRASQNIHDLIFHNLIQALKRFFDTSPSGRALNRFSKDLGAVDELLPRSLLETLQMYLAMSSVLVLNAIALPWTLIPTAFLVVLFVLLLRWYLQAAQAVKRLEGTTKSPVFGMINSTISGLSTIRSSNAEHRLQKQFDQAQNLHSSAFYTFLGGSSAFGLYLDALCLVYLGLVMTIFIVFEFDGVIPVGSAGLAVSQSMVLTMLLQMAARFTADFLAQMTSVERTLEYSKLPKEQYMDEGPTVPPSTWPATGQIKFVNVFMKYGTEDPYVLTNLNVEIQSGWKVGVVGRTGAGKSSLISALFRLTDIEGSIKIDGIDTFGIAKSLLRSKISIIPQEPVLFSASIRYNLDPFDKYSDDDIWRALEQVELKEAVPALDYMVTEGGSNFSMGQRQLLCLARAVLRSNKILIMDEATANVDPQTDALIQKTIRREFAACTVITIAHRLITIMDSDRVLVMDQGQAVEFDWPYVLLSKPDSHLNFLVKETNDSMRKVLNDIAKTKFIEDNPQ